MATIKTRRICFELIFIHFTKIINFFQNDSLAQTCKDPDITTEKALEESQIKAANGLNKKSGDCQCDIPQDEKGERINMNNKKPNLENGVATGAFSIFKTFILFIFTIIMFWNYPSMPSIPSFPFTVK